ncbi:glycine cleavage system protein GcvH [Sneathiella limimaris]|uniref:glycine cleavage system protein GcvH n=1 Tax=Sneathiella limimaris TaxID=1964213 RepID=UPI00146C6AFC|nr:glycine cleavage system protein GcvH [Sneathiella limimaris]
MSIKYTKDHEWVTVDGDVATIGISVYAQEQLGDVVFVEVPEMDQSLGKSDSLAVVESVKAASDVYTPVSGEVVEVNSELEDNPSLVNEDAEGSGWFAKLKISDAGELDELMSADEYKEYVEGLG